MNPTAEPAAKTETQLLIAERDDARREADRLADVALVLKCERDALAAALAPFAEKHGMGDNYVQFHPRLIEAARAALAKEGL